MGIKKTLFAYPDWLFDFVSLLFGLWHAPATLQTALDLFTMGLMWKKLLIYLEDIIILGPTFEILL